MNDKLAVQKAPEKEMSYTPFAGADKIKLSVSIVQNLIAVPTRSGKTCSPKEAVKFMMLCEAQRLNPFAGDAYLVGYDNQKTGQATFSLITAHQALLKRAEASPEFEGMESGIILVDENGKVEEREGDFHLPEEKVAGGWARVHRKGRKPTYRRLSLAQRRPAYDTPFWQGNKASEQIVKCAEADALRATFPSLMGGLYTEGEHSRAVIDVSSVPADLPTNKLVAFKPQDSEGEQQGDEVGNSPQASQEPKKSDTAEKLSPQAQLTDIVINAGFTFDDFTAWAVDQGHLKEDAAAGFAELSDELCARMVRAHKGLLAGLSTVKGGQ